MIQLIPEVPDVISNDKVDCELQSPDRHICDIIFHVAAAAMKALNAKGIVHRDLKPQNILLCHTGRLGTPGAETKLKIGQCPEVLQQRNDQYCDCASVNTSAKFSWNITSMYFFYTYQW